MVVWLKRSSLAKPVLKEKQKLLGLPEHAVILDIKNRWNSLFLMVERFLEQFPAIQAAAMDARLKVRKLEHHFTVSAEDSTFTQCIKEKIWGDLSKRYQEECIQQFLEESTALDPRFKSRVAA
ncbi:hypothetical protein R3I94_007019 [Phoxinus phoxinus]